MAKQNIGESLDIVSELSKKFANLLRDLETKFISEIQKGRGKYSLRTAEAFNKATPAQLRAFEDAVLGKSGEKAAVSFIVGEVFRHRDSNCVPQYHGDNAKNWIFEPNKRRSIPIEVNGKLNEFVLPKNMYDSEIQTAAKSTPMVEDALLVILYLLVIKPEMGKELLNYQLSKDKWYVFHVTLSSGKAVAVDVYWSDDEWFVYCNAWNDFGSWKAGLVCLSLATA